MAILMKSLVTEYSMMGRNLIACTVCENIINAKVDRRELSVDDGHKEKKQLENKLQNIKIGYVFNGGTTSYICPDCVRKMYNEVCQPEIKAEDIQDIEVSEAVDTQEKPKAKGGKNASKATEKSE